ncbi:hypothetical protein Pcinc_003074 [Petrolisthes cinctipes]|uniref:Uncharacterized protein n=1 Tax=Petrolisthes cinctipes TaxID=88211 RepID=A0AAE1GJN4_PETCI|nr:hypothetical protein Pcinc_003074 [Petrolisthes cinctipes]
MTLIIAVPNGVTVTSSWGHSVEDFLFSHDLFVLNSGNRDDVLNCFYTTLQTVGQASILNTGRPASAKQVPWWNKECAKELHVKRANWKRYQRKRGSPMEDHAYILYKHASAVFR